MFVGDSDGRSDSDGRDIREFYGVLGIFARYIASMWIGGNGLYLFIDERKRWRGSILIALASILVIVATITGGSGCPPWRWGHCWHDHQQQTEYRQTFEHGENVSQIPLAVTR